MFFDNAYFIKGSAYAGKSTMVKLLAEKHGGILCEENYHDRYSGELDSSEFPCLTYTRDLKDWHDFIRRTPEEYLAWIDGVAKECEILELRILKDLCTQGKPVFVDSNISLETLKKITPHKLRSTYATNLYNETGDIYLVADVLGHTSVDTTRKHYADMTDARRKMAAEHVHLPGDPEFKPGR